MSPATPTARAVGVFFLYTPHRTIFRHLHSIIKCGILNTETRAVRVQQRNKQKKEVIVMLEQNQVAQDMQPVQVVQPTATNATNATEENGDARAIDAYWSRYYAYMAWLALRK